jgi:hypothetical protein
MRNNRIRCAISKRRKTMDEQQKEAVVKVVGMGASSALTAAALAFPPVAVGIAIAVAAGAVYCAVEGGKSTDSSECSHTFVEKRTEANDKEIYCRDCGKQIC